MKKLTQLLALCALFLGSAPAVADAHKESETATPLGVRLFEMRTYHTHPDRKSVV